MSIRRWVLAGMVVVLSGCGLSLWHLCLFRTNGVAVSVDGALLPNARVFHRKDEYAVQPFPQTPIYYVIRPTRRTVGVPSCSSLIDLGFVLVAKETDFETVEVRDPKVDTSRAWATFSQDRYEFSDLHGHSMVVQRK